MLLEALGLGLDASAEDVRLAFRSLMKQHHPDAGGDEDRAKEITDAYTELRRRGRAA